MSALRSNCLLLIVKVKVRVINSVVFIDFKTPDRTELLISQCGHIRSDTGENT